MNSHFIPRVGLLGMLAGTLTLTNMPGADMNREGSPNESNSRKGRTV
jgi:hypothetical protein